MYVISCEQIAAILTQKDDDGGGGGDSPLKRIYIIYMGSCRAIYSYIAASTSDLVRPRPSASDEPNPRSRGYIAVYSPPRPHIYITHILSICW